MCEPAQHQTHIAVPSALGSMAKLMRIEDGPVDFHAYAASRLKIVHLLLEPRHPTGVTAGAREQVALLQSGKKAYKAFWRNIAFRSYAMHVRFDGGVWPTRQPHPASADLAKALRACALLNLNDTLDLSADGSPAARGRTDPAAFRLKAKARWSEQAPRLLDLLKSPSPPGRNLPVVLCCGFHVYDLMPSLLDQCGIRWHERDLGKPDGPKFSSLFIAETEAGRKVPFIRVNHPCVPAKDDPRLQQKFEQALACC